MYVPGTKFEVKLTIKLGNVVIEPVTNGEIIESVTKMVGKSYKVMLEDGMTPEIHIVLMNNQTELISD